MPAAGRIPSTYTRGQRNEVVFHGDSLTQDKGTLGVSVADSFPSLLQDQLVQNGYAAVCRNIAISGNTTANMLTRIEEVFQRPFGRVVPKIVVIGTGGNDSGGGLTLQQTTNNFTAMVLYVREGCTGQVAARTSLPANAAEGTRYLVTSDDSTTGGLATPTGSTITTVTGTLSGSPPRVWYCRNGKAGETGWSRVGNRSDPVVTRIALWTPWFQNFTTGGDTVNAANDGHDGQVAAYAQAWDAAVAVAAAQTVQNFDPYVWTQARISAGKDAAGSFSWHVADGNVHSNLHGRYLLRDFFYEKIAAQSGWLTALQGD